MPSARREAPTRSTARSRPRLADQLIALGPTLAALLVLGLVLLVWAGYRALDPTPTKHIVIATGPEQGAYVEFARRYKPLLQAQGISVELRPSQGSRQNLQWLRDARSGVQAAFVQGGVEGEDAAESAGDSADADDGDPLLSLGSVAPEPLWLFYREARVDPRLRRAPQRLSELEGWRIHTGPAGGGTGTLLRRLAAANGLTTPALAADGREAVHAVVELVQGRIDALAMVSAADAPLVQYLLRTPGVALFNFAQSEAYARRFPFLAPQVLPRGVVDLAADRPAADVHLVAVTASLVVRADLHPALQQLLVQTASAVHAEGGWFARPGEYPNATASEFALAEEAARHHRNGPPWLQRHLPFWLANFVDRMWVLLLPLLAALLPLARLLPPLITMRLRSRVYRWYAHLRAIESELDGGAADPEQLSERLERLDRQTEKIGVPLAYAHELYDLREHIHGVRKRLRQRLAAPEPAAVATQPAAS